jgi:hypothetical protein
MAYGHAERNLVLIRKLEAETAQLLDGVAEPDSEQSAWLRDVASQDKPTATPTAGQGRETAFPGRSRGGVCQPRQFRLR